MVMLINRQTSDNKVKAIKPEINLYAFTDTQINFTTCVYHLDLSHTRNTVDDLQWSSICAVYNEENAGKVHKKWMNEFCS